MMESFRNRAAGERGTVMVLFALVAPVIVLFLIYVIDVNNWQEHQRHLQVQADAAALAAAQYFQPCQSSSIYATAGQYGGAPSVTTPAGTVSSTAPLQNQQVGGTTSSDVHVLVNSSTYYNQPTNPAPDDTTASDPCNPPAGQIPMVDVKMTETNLPWYFRPLSSVPFINAHARVSVYQQTNAHTSEALAVSDSSPAAARAYFVNEDNNDAVIASTPLTPPNAQDQSVWSNSSSPVPVPINAAHIGVVIALSGNGSDTTCGHPYVQCFDEGSTGPSLLHIQGWSATGTATLTAPLARSVALSTAPPDTCTDGYFSSSTTTCTESISAWVDYGSTNTKGVTIKPVVAGSTEAALSPGATNGTAVQWTGKISLVNPGSNQIDLQVSCSKGAGAACGSSASTGPVTIKDVQRAYAAGSGSGTITGAWISEVGGASQDANSFEVDGCGTQNPDPCTHQLVVTVDVAGALENSQHYSDPTYAIRIGTSQANVVGCGANAGPSASQYRQNLGQGCTGPFTVNNSDPTCANAATSPYDCVVLVNGVKQGPFTQGLSDRIVNSPPAGDQYYCKNNWSDNNNGGVPVIPSNDSRLITLFVMPYGSTDASGQPLLSSGYVPVKTFATFYVTGFAGDPCSSDDPAPANAGNAWIEGHFIKYIDTLGDGTGSTGCVLSALGTCVAILDR